MSSEAATQLAQVATAGVRKSSHQRYGPSRAARFDRNARDPMSAKHVPHVAVSARVTRAPGPRDERLGRFAAIVPSHWAGTSARRPLRCADGIEQRGSACAARSDTSRSAAAKCQCAAESPRAARPAIRAVGGAPFRGIMRIPGGRDLLVRAPEEALAGLRRRQLLKGTHPPVVERIPPGAGARPLRSFSGLRRGTPAGGMKPMVPSHRTPCSAAGLKNRADGGTRPVAKEARDEGGLSVRSSRERILS